METTTQIEVKQNAQILFDRPNCIVVGRVIEVREKAVKMDYMLEPISVYRGPLSCIVYSYSCWIPKSVLIADERVEQSYGVKKWFEKTFKGGHRIKNYFIAESGKQVFV
jgi:hypothetical protein